jgi:hypothetical protein
MRSRKIRTITKKPSPEFASGLEFTAGIWTEPKIEFREIYHARPYGNPSDNCYRCYLPNVGAHMEVDMGFSKLFIISRAEKWEENLAAMGYSFGQNGRRKKTAAGYNYDRHGRNLIRAETWMIKKLNGYGLVTEYKLNWVMRDPRFEVLKVADTAPLDLKNENAIIDSIELVKFRINGGPLRDWQIETAEAREISVEGWEAIADEIHRLAQEQRKIRD